MDVGLVCDACSALTPIGVPQCARCGEPVALDPRRAKKASAGPISGKPATAGVSAQPATVQKMCPKCSSPVPGATRFCPACGQNLTTPPPINSLFDVETKVGPRTDVATKPNDGHKPGRSTLFFGGALQAARAKLTLNRGDGADVGSFTPTATG